MEIIALDAHKRYSQVCVQNQKGQFLCETRINHSKGAIKQFLAGCSRHASDEIVES